MIRIYNTLTRKKDEFKPIRAGEVGLYVCGITAYDSCHLGHARGAIVFDTIVRYLRHQNYKVKFVRNYTDVDDKIIKRSNEEGLPCEEITERYIKEYEKDMAALGALSPDIKPKATEHIDDMIEAVKRLIEKGFAYEINGSVYYSVRKFPGYGKLSGKKIEELESGARVEVDESKKDPLDFALWKASKPGEPKWSSPWGEGRPGWHIECSVMSSKYLGQPFDIHGGGRDLVFPHHENEIAQAEAICGCEFAHYWLHNGFVNINAEKMSKSLGNIKTIREIINLFDPEVVRYFLLSNHYRSPIDYTEENMINAERSVGSFYSSLEHIVEYARFFDEKKVVKFNNYEKDLMGAVENLCKEFEKAMEDDFNTALAVGLVFDMLRGVNGYVIDKKKASSKDATSKISNAFVGVIKNLIYPVLGFFGSDVGDFQERSRNTGIKRLGLDRSRIESLIKDRADARMDKDFKRADEIRNRLDEMHIEIKDRPDGRTDWSVKI